MIAFPILATLISLACAVTIARDARRRPRPDKIAWAIAFAVFAVAAGCEVVGAIWGWNPSLARLYYVTGATLVVGYLAVGELYLLAPARIAAVAPGATLLLTAIAAAMVWAAPVDADRIAGEGWDAIDRGPGLIALTAGINAFGTLVLVGGALWSAWRFWRRGIQRHRMIGCLLIAVGTLIVASGGTLTRFGSDQYFYVAMAIGVAVIYAGYLETRRSTPAAALSPALSPAGGQPEAAVLDRAPASSSGRATLVSLRGWRDRAPIVPGGVPSPDPALDFIEARVLPLDDAALDHLCRAWSVPRPPGEAMARGEARRTWMLRLRLSAAGQVAFDALEVGAQRQVSELYHEVLAPGLIDWRGERAGTGR